MNALTEMQIKKLRHAQLRVMLEYLGLDYRKHAHKLEGLKEQLSEMNKLHPDKAYIGYQVIVLKKDPTATLANTSAEPAMPRNAAYAAVAEFMRDRWESIANTEMTSLREKAEQTINSVAGDVQKKTSEAIAAESKKFRRIEIAQRGKKATKVMEGVLPKEFDKICQLGNQRKNILMVGPAGCGKTYIAGKLAEALGLEYSSISCSEGMSESMLTGWLLPTGAGGKFEYVASQFIERYENGGVFLYDEIDASDPNVLVFVNQALAGDHFFLPQRFKKPRIDRHPDFVAIAAANTYGNGADAVYVGRTQLDAATLDRFRIGTVQMQYDKDVEDMLVGSRNAEVYQKCLSIREAINTHKIRRFMSTRFMKDAVDMVNNEGWSLNDALERYFSDWSREERALVARTV